MVAYERRDLRALVEPIVDGFQAFAQSKGLTLSLRAPDDLPEVTLDPERLDTVLCNLISNACKFTDEGGTVLVKLQPEEGHLAVIESHAAGRIVDAVLVHDGPIDPATRARYEAEGAAPLGIHSAIHGLAVIRRDLLGPGPKLRHDPAATAEGLLEAWRALVRPGPTANAR